MQFGDIIDNNNKNSIIVENLRKMIDSNRLPHAILLSEKPGYGALPIALATAQYLLCKKKSGADSCGVCPTCKRVSKLIHPDIHYIFPTNTSSLSGTKRGEIETFYPAWRELVISNPNFNEQQLYSHIKIESGSGIIGVSEANNILGKLALSSFEGGAKITIIMFPERMNTESANKLLKLLEEPTDNTYFFLISHNPIRIISTILSRCRIMELLPVAHNKPATEEDLNIEFSNAFYLILKNALNKKLSLILDEGERLSTFGKERQKSFALNSIEIIRKLYITALNLPQISYAWEEEKESLNDISKRINIEFYNKCYNYLNSIIELLDRNVNPKFIFCDFACFIYFNIR